MGICEVLIPLTASPSVEVQGNSAAALGNLSSKSEFLTSSLARECLADARLHSRRLLGFQRRLDRTRGRTSRLPRSLPRVAGYHLPAHRHLDSGPAPRIWRCAFLTHSLSRSPANPHPIADPTLENQIRSSKDLIPLATHLSTLTSSESQDGEASHTEGSDDGEADGGESEIRVLARTVLDLLEGN